VGRLVRKEEFVLLQERRASAAREMDMKKKVSIAATASLALCTAEAPLS